MWMPGATELIVIGLVGLLLFGRRLPEVGRSLGKSIVEFKKGIRDDVASRPSTPSKTLPSAEPPAALPDASPTNASTEQNEATPKE
jgi:sec-independent protein translocase protein TatA